MRKTASYASQEVNSKFRLRIDWLLNAPSWVFANSSLDI